MWFGRCYIEVCESDRATSLVEGSQEPVEEHDVPLMETLP